MQDPNALLAILRTMAQKPEVQFDKLYQKLYNVELWLLAYQSIAPKPGNMTAGVDGKTIDGAGLELITELIADLKASRYTPHPVRRTYVQSERQLRPLGIPTFQEKLLQTVVKFLLEAIYEPTFSEASHGFRPQRSCHTALEQIGNEMYGVRWWVEGDIKGFFDHVSHDILITILSKRCKRYHKRGPLAIPKVEPLSQKSAMLERKFEQSGGKERCIPWHFETKFVPGF